MKLFEISKVQPAAQRIVSSALEELGNPKYRMFHPEGAENLLTVHFPAENKQARGSLNFVNEPGKAWYEEELENDRAAANRIASELLSIIQNSGIDLEDSSIETTARGVNLFMVSDSFVGQ